MDVTPRISTPRDTTAREFYMAYLQTGDWRVRRNRALKRADFRCEQCGGKRTLEVHHKTYERLGREWDQDLAVLCAHCHSDTHGMVREGMSSRVYFALASELLMAPGIESIADLSAALKAKCATLKIPYNANAGDEAVSAVSRRRLVWRAHRRPSEPPQCGLSEEQRPITRGEATAICARLFSGTEIVRSMPSPPSFLWNQTEDEYLR